MASVVPAVADTLPETEPTIPLPGQGYHPPALRNLQKLWLREAYEQTPRSRQSFQWQRFQIQRPTIRSVSNLDPEEWRAGLPVFDFDHEKWSSPSSSATADEPFASITVLQPARPAFKEALLSLPSATKSRKAALSSFLLPHLVAAESAAGFPAEVIDEVIVPVPSEIFLVLDKLGKPDWKSELRKARPPTFAQRIDVSLVLGSVVAEGFIAVQAQDQDAVERIGRDVLKLSESLGLKETVLPHTNSILEASKNSHWEIVRVELDKTQKTVRDTMEERRDRELSQCVSLGGWLRGTEAVTSLISRNYTSDSAELLNQPDIVRHFQKELKKIAARNPKLQAMLAGLDEISRVIGTGDEPPNAAGIQSIRVTSARLVKSISTPPGKPAGK
jgi:hypothetical protein